jgi:hypothetical protein
MNTVAKSAQERAFGVYNLIWDPDMLYADYGKSLCIFFAVQNMLQQQFAC